MGTRFGDVRAQTNLDLSQVSGVRVSDEEVLAKFTEILRDLLGNESIGLNKTTTRGEVPGWDSFNYINFIVAVEMQFGIKFKVADVESFQTVGDIVAMTQALAR
jgi:acyl carrier protein